MVFFIRNVLIKSLASVCQFKLFTINPIALTLKDLTLNPAHCLKNVSFSLVLTMLHKLLFIHVLALTLHETHILFLNANVTFQKEYKVFNLIWLIK